MHKIMLVEDDDNLREIYSIRLTAEGYQVSTAHDGEEALAVVVKERPDLIITDVMMPKISGFNMLDILRSTPEMDGIKVIMMTALSSDEQRTRGESLGADRYLVKSQVGIEDVVNVVHEVLGDRADSGANTPTTADAPAPAEPMTQPNATPNGQLNIPQEPMVATAQTPEINPAMPAPEISPVAPAMPVQAAPANPVAPAQPELPPQPPVNPIA